jgi:hypothetical protein
LNLIGRTTNSLEAPQLEKAIQALAPRLTEQQAEMAVNQALGMIERTTEPRQLEAVGNTIEALESKLSGTQVSAALNLVINQIGRTTEHGQLLALAHGVLALSSKLNGDQASNVARIAQTQLATARTDEEAAAWAIAFAKTAPQDYANDYLRRIVDIFKYPTAGWPKATNVLMAALAERFPDVSELKDGIDAALPWFRQKLGADLVAQPPVRPTLAALP